MAKNYPRSPTIISYGKHRITYTLNKDTNTKERNDEKTIKYYIITYITI